MLHKMRQQKPIIGNSKALHNRDKIPSTARHGGGGTINTEEEEGRCFNSPSSYHGRGGEGAEATNKPAAASRESCGTLARSKVSLLLPKTQSDIYRRDGRLS